MTNLKRLTVGSMVLGAMICTHEGAMGGNLSPADCEVIKDIGYSLSSVGFHVPIVHLDDTAKKSDFEECTKTNRLQITLKPKKSRPPTDSVQVIACKYVQCKLKSALSGKYSINNSPKTAFSCTTPGAWPMVITFGDDGARLGSTHHSTQENINQP